MNCEHKRCCLCGKAVAITYSRVDEQHLEVPFLLFGFESLFFIWCRYLKYTLANPEHIALKKYFILHCIVYLYDYVVYKFRFEGKIKSKKKKQ